LEGKLSGKASILVCDDRPAAAQRWTDRLMAIPEVRAQFAIEALKSPDEFHRQVSALDNRRRGATNWDGEEDWEVETVFDRADILVIDYDLYGLASGATGERVAYLARCYSRCGLIIALNQFRPRGFDLRLRGHPQSFADLNISDRQLDNAGLWSTQFRGFRPWSWPLLPNALASYRKRVIRLVTRLDDDIFDELGFSGSLVPSLGRDVEGFLEGRRRAERVTFEDFVRFSGQGIRADDKAPRPARARIAAARVGKWVERLVLPGQDAAVDAPHLVGRFPSLLTGSATRITSWNRSAQLTNDIQKLGIDHPRIERFRAKNDLWFSRPVWFWAPLANHAEIEEVAEPWKLVEPKFVFAEDVSRFLPREDAREFVADLSTPFRQRWVTGTTDAAKKARGPARISYHPPGRFAR
jgi:hypothetical protein